MPLPRTAPGWRLRVRRDAAEEAGHGRSRCCCWGCGTRRGDCRAGRRPAWLAGSAGAQGGAGRPVGRAGRRHLLVRAAAVRRPLRGVGRHPDADLARGGLAGRGGRLEPGHLLGPHGHRHARAPVPPGGGADRVDDGGGQLAARGRRSRRRPDLLDAVVVGLLEVEINAVGAGDRHLEQLRQVGPADRGARHPRRAGRARRGPGTGGAPRARRAGRRPRGVRADPAERGLRPPRRTRRRTADVRATQGRAQGARARVGPCLHEVPRPRASGWCATAGRR